MLGEVHTLSQVYTNTDHQRQTDRQTHTLTPSIRPLQVPWFAAFGNHDLGDSDLYATCPEKAPRVRIAGQAYASNQLDASKGGYRPSRGNTTSFHLPDFNYRATLDALNFEIYGLDQNYKDVSGIGGNNSTHQQGKLCVCVCVQW
jgi:hypothetical protein